MLRSTYATRDRQLAQLMRDVRTEWQRTEAPEPTRRSALDIASELGITLDPWQRNAITSDAPDILLLVTRQGGKGEVATLLALDKLLNDAGSTTVVISKSERQAKRLLLRIKRRYHMLSHVPIPIVNSQYAFELRNGSEVLALPGSEDTVRGIEAVDLLLIDEAAFVPDELQGTVYPMLATTNGRSVNMTTPHGKRGWFYKAWVDGGEDWHRERITWRDIPESRFKPGFIERTKRRLGDWMFRQEFECEFMDDESQFYATELVDAALTDVDSLALPTFGAAA